MTVTIERSVAVSVEVDGRRLTARTLSGTVADLLRELGVTLGPHDRVTPGLTTEVTPLMQVRVTRVRVEEVTVQEEIPFETWRWAEPRWEKGRVGLLREGSPGLRENVFRLVYEDGRLVRRELVASRVVREPRARIIGVGTKVLVHTLRTRAGVIRYTEVKDMVATAYYPGPESTAPWTDGLTYTGVKAGLGVVAVDPEVIPLGTRLYIPGYGLAVAADIGGAIKGNRIDLGFDTYREAIYFGRRRVKVYILAD